MLCVVGFTMFYGSRLLPCLVVLLIHLALICPITAKAPLTEAEKMHIMRSFQAVTDPLKSVVEMVKTAKTINDYRSGLQTLKGLTASVSSISGAVSVLSAAGAVFNLLISFFVETPT